MGSNGFLGGKRQRPASSNGWKRRVRPELQLLEDRIVPSLTKLGQWNNGSAYYSDGWGVTQNGRQYAYVGHYGNENGIHIVDITNPASPFLVSQFKSTKVFNGETWNDFRDVEIEQKGGRRTFGYFSSDGGGGVTIVNTSNPANPVEIFRITSSQQGHNNVHTLSVDGNYLYEADSRTSVIKVFNVTNPANPTFIRNIISATETVHEVTAINGRLYVAGIFGSPRVEIYDISQVANLGVPVTRLGTVFSGSRAHTAWPTEDGNFVAVAHEKEGGNLSFWDVTNPSNPQLAWSLALPTSQSYCVHQVMIKGDRLYAAWYQAGIFVYDISNRFNPVLLGNYDTYAGAVNFYNGAWGVYPFLGDSKILGIDMVGGLFILSLDDRSDSDPVPEASPRITLAPGEQPIGVTGGVLRIVLDNNHHQVTVSSNTAAHTIDVTLDGGDVLQFDASDILRLNIYGGDGNDRFVFDPNITQAIFLDGGGGTNVVKDWPAFYSSKSHLSPTDHHALVTGEQRGQHYEAHSIQEFETGDSVALPTTGMTTHGIHLGRISGVTTSSNAMVVTGNHAAMFSGLAAGSMANSHSLMGTIHGGGKISPELMVRTSTNNQVGGQVAYHKPG